MYSFSLCTRRLFLIRIRIRITHGQHAECEIVARILLVSNAAPSAGGVVHRVACDSAITYKLFTSSVLSDDPDNECRASLVTDHGVNKKNQGQTVNNKESGKYYKRAPPNPHKPGSTCNLTFPLSTPSINPVRVTKVYINSSRKRTGEQQMSF